MTNHDIPTRHWLRCGQGSAQKRGVCALSLTFKENCPDLRSTQVMALLGELHDYDEPRAEYGLDFVATPKPEVTDGELLAVAHDVYRDAGHVGLRHYGRPSRGFYDPKSVFARDESDLRL